MAAYTLSILKRAIPVFALIGLIAGCQNHTEDSQSIIGTWQVEYIKESPVMDRSPAQLVFLEENNRLAGNASCNNIMGAYTLEGNQLSFGQTATTRKLCPPALMDQEQRFLQALDEVSQVNFENGLLILEDNNKQLIFKASRVETE